MNGPPPRPARRPANLLRTRNRPVLWKETVSLASKRMSPPEIMLMTMKSGTVGRSSLNMKEKSSRKMIMVDLQIVYLPFARL